MFNDDGKLGFKISVDESDLDKAELSVKRKFGSITDTAVKEGKKLDLSMASIGKSITSLIGPATALGVAFEGMQLAKKAYDFETAFSMAMREVQTISKAVQDDFEGISDKIADMAARGVDDAIKLTNAFYQIVSAGYDGEEGLRLLEISSKAATAGLTDTTTAADGLTTVLNAWGMGVENAEKVADVMFKTVERGKTTFGELASSIAQVAPLAASNNIAFEEIFAALQSITKQGTPTAQAMTQIRSSIVNMTKVLGDGWSSTMTYQEGLARIAEMAGGSQNKLKELIPDVEGVNAVLALTGEKARGAAEDLNETAKAVGAMETAHSRMMEEADNKWAVVYNKWTRKLREIGEVAKAGSGYLADFFNVLLTDTQADIIDPGAQKIVDGVEKSISAITDKDEKLAAIIKKINELKNNRINVLNPESTTLESNLPNWMQRRAEDLNSLLGLQSKTFTPGRYTAAELEYTNNQIAITKQAEEGLMQLFTQVSNTTEKQADQQLEAPIKKIRTLKEMLDDLKAQEDRLGTGTVEADVLTLAQIKTIKQEIKAYYDQIRKLQQEAGVSSITPKSEQLSGGIEPIKKVSLEFDKLNKKIEEGGKKAAKMRSELEGMQQQERLEKTLALTTEISGVVNDITQKYAEQLGLNEDQAAALEDGLQAISGIADLASGNYVQGAAKIVDSMLGYILGADEKLSEHFENVQAQVEKIITSVSIASDSLSNLNVDASLTSISILKSQLSDLADEAQKLNEKFPEGYSYGPYRSSYSSVIKNIVNDAADLNEEIEKLSNRLLKGGLSDDQRKSIEAVLEGYNNLMSSLDSTIEGVIGVSVADLRNSLADAFFTAEDAATAWGDTVNDVIANIAKNQLISKLLTDPVNDAVNSLLNSFSDGELSTADIERFQSTMAALYESATPAFEEAISALEGLGIDFGSGSSYTGLTGSIQRSLTEETGSELAGLWRKTSDDTRQIRDYSREALENMEAIKLNTAETVTELKNAVSRLDQIVDNTKNSYWSGSQI